MNQEQIANLANDLRRIAEKITRDRYVGGTGAFLDFRLIEDLNAALESIGYELVREESKGAKK